jgi:RNA polymerase sigma-70 factor (ECF subfamily)
MCDGDVSEPAREQPYGDEAFGSILEAARAGADWAWSRLYRDLAGPVLGYLRGRGATDPEDLLGEVFLQVARNIATFEGGERAFRSWVFTVAHHRVIDERRYRGRRPAVLSGDPPPGVAGGDVEQEALDHLGTHRVLELLDHLSPDQREVLLLRIVADLTIEEAARVVGKRPGAVKALQRRGLEALRRRVGQKGVPL